MQTFAETVTPYRGTKAGICIGNHLVLEAAQPAGVIVSQGSADDGAIVPASAGAVAAAIGVVVYNPLQPAPSDDATTNDFSAGDVAEVVSEGTVWVVSETGIAAGAQVYCRHTANGAGKLQLGAVRHDNDGGGATVALLPGCRAITTSTGTNPVKLRLNLPYGAAA
jgi:hypothetical protein